MILALRLNFTKLVRQVRSGIATARFVIGLHEVRLMRDDARPTERSSRALVAMLVDAGAELIAVHGRTRAGPCEERRRA